MAIPGRINIVTLGVRDLTASSAFYEGLGWHRAGRKWEADVRFFTLHNIVLALFPRALLAKDANVENTPTGFGGVTLAINLASESEVDEVLNTAVVAGATLLKSAKPAPWGGYSGYFADPDGYPWEVAYNPFFPLDVEGKLSVPD